MTDQVSVKLSRTTLGPSFALIGDEDTLKMLVDIVGDSTDDRQQSVNTLHKDLLRTLKALQALKDQ